MDMLLKPFVKDPCDKTQVYHSGNIYHMFEINTYDGLSKRSYTDATT